MQEIPTVQQPPQVPQQPPMYPPHPYQEYAAVEQPAPAPQPPMYQQQPPMYPPPTYQPPQKPPHSRKRLWLIIGIVAAVILVMGILGNIIGTQEQTATTPQATQPTQQVTTQPVPTLAPTEVPQPTPTVAPTQPTQSPAQIEKAYKSSTQVTTVTTLDKQGNAWKGKDVHFTSTISDFVKDSDGNTAYSNVDDPNSSGVILIVYPNGTAFEKLNAGDTLEVWGFDAGTVSGTNAYGADIQIVAIEVKYLTDQTTGYATH